MLPTADPKATVSEVIERIMSGQSATLVKRHKELLVCCFSPAERMELSTFRNQLIHLFAKEAALALSLYSCFKAGADSDNGGTVYKRQLMGKGEMILQLLKNEFIFKPSEVRNTQALETSFEKTLQSMIESSVIAPVTSFESDDLHKSSNGFKLTYEVQRSLNRMLRNGTTSVASSTPSPRNSAAGLDQMNAQTKPPGVYDGGTVFELCCYMLFPFIDSYFLAALALHALVPGRQVMGEAALVSLTQSVGELMYFDGQLDHFEAIGKETLVNALSVFVDRGIIERIRVSTDEKSSVASLKLTRNSHAEDVNDLIRGIDLFRKVPSRRGDVLQNIEYVQLYMDKK